MAKIDCTACDDLRENVPDLVTNGLTKSMCTSLQNDTGLNPNLNVQHTDCEDLDDANDCLVGMMDTDIEKYEVCDWKKFMHRVIPNLHQFLKMMICAICGLWTNVHNLWEQIEELWAEIQKIWNKITEITDSITNILLNINKLSDAIDAIDDQSERVDCIVNYLTKGAANISISENTSGNAYAVAGKGVSFLNAGHETHAVDLYIQYIAGGLMRIGGSYRFNKENFEDGGTCKNFDNGTVERTSLQRKGNSYWGTDGRYAKGGELICEFRIKKSAYPYIRSFVNGFGQESGGGAYHVRINIFDEGAWAYGQHGWCDSNGQPQEDGYDGGHKVPDGWIYIQVRMTYCWQMGANNGQYSPVAFFGVRMDQDKIPC